MSSGIVVCSKCNRELHQTGPQAPIRPCPRDTDGDGNCGQRFCPNCGRDRPSTWIHCEDQTPRCDGATSAYPTNKEAIVGRWCGRDEEPF